MINFENTACLPAYTTREVRNYGRFEANSLYKFLFTREDNLLLSTGAIKLLPFSMLYFYASHNIQLCGEKYNTGDTLDISKIDENTLKTLVKTNVIKFDFIDKIKNLSDEEIVKLAKTYDLVGKTFKQTSDELGIDFDTIKNKFGLKQGGAKKLVKPEDIEKFIELLGE